MNKIFFLIILIFTLGLSNSLAQIPNFLYPKELTQKPWSAKWITVPNTSKNGYGVYHFRKTITLEEKPKSFIVHISGDNRYKFYVNGKMICLGPARGDVLHWHFETIDLSPYLKAGKNNLAAVVWNFGEHSPAAQISYRTGFIVQGNGENQQVINTNNSWKAITNNAYKPIKPTFNGFIVVGANEGIDANKFPWNWETENFDDSNWKNAQEISPGLMNGLFEPWYEGWSLMPRKIPAMELKPQRFQSIRKSIGVIIPNGFPKEKQTFTIPANTTATLLLDQGVETNAYTFLDVSEGKEANISIMLAESLYQPGGIYTHKKGNRNEIEGKDFVGCEDSLFVDGGKNRTFTSLWWRAFRFVKIVITTKDNPLIFNDISSIFTSYPFEKKATFETISDSKSDEEFQNILEIGWRTARLCANETYIDCPYFEQMQYVTDTRIQALVSLYNSGDDRLMRNAILHIRNSHGVDGLTMSRYPTSMHQYLPTFSLWWIAMLNDYLKYRGDKPFIKEMLPVTREIIHFFELKQTHDKTLGFMPYWNFTDWADGKNWRVGIGPVAKNGQSAMIDLQLLLAYQAALELEKAVGLSDFVKSYQQNIEKLKVSIYNKYWDSKTQMFADTPEKKDFSQHTNTLAVLGEVISGGKSKALMNIILTDKAITQATIYFKFYLHQAVAKAGLGDRYLDLLGEWKEQINLGLSTWAETPEPSRSDCHAWGASPNIDFFRIVLGIDSDGIGFEKVVIEPHLGNLKNVKGSIPHPLGEISVKYSLNQVGKLSAEIFLPNGISGRFIWKGTERKIVGGKQVLVF